MSDLTACGDAAAKASRVAGPHRSPVAHVAYAAQTLAIGASEAERFHPGMSTEFLSRIGELATFALLR